MNYAKKPDRECRMCGSHRDRTIVTELGIIPEIVQCMSCGIFFNNRASDTLEYKQGVVDRRYDQKRLVNSRVIVYKKEIPLIKKLYPNSSDPILDIGCSEGLFLSMMRSNGYIHGHGIEISSVTATDARKQFPDTIYTDPLSECTLPTDYFGMVSLWGVFDVLPDPAKDLQEIHRILKPGGLIILRVLNMRFHIPGFRLCRYFSNIIKTCPFTVQNHGFTAETLTTLLKRSGFKIEGARNSVPSFGDPYGKGNRFKILCMICVKSVVYGLAQLTAFVSMGKILISPSIIVFARKPMIQPTHHS
ncbi:MAG: methyltransferase domain-containing protein [Elusimicrobia bacterium]|nr:methyltransferase domain-containing protein [Elusimicrobiota bacterium]MBD3411524.1 methyltransferase domain-containing protein [Elusimicrobiota bacterium]